MAKDLISIDVCLTGDAEHHLTKLSEAYKGHNLNGGTVNKEDIINRVIDDYTDEFNSFDNIHQDLTMLRIHYLMLSQNSVTYFSNTAERRGRMRAKAQMFILSVQEFCDLKYKAFHSKGTVINALFHDAIIVAKLKGEDFIQTHIIKHTNGSHS